MEQYVEPLIKSLLLFAFIFVIAAIGFAFVRRYRDRAADDMASSSELMSKFRDLHSEGGLSDEEFRTIKTKLARELKTEINSNDNNG